MFDYEQLGDTVLFRRRPSPLNRARTGLLVPSSVEVAALSFNGVDVQVRKIDIACAQAFGR
jgi:hypothetical protein